MSTETTTFTKLDLDDQKDIKAKYMEGYSSAQLAADYNLIRQSLDWVIRHHHWKEQRHLQRAELFQQFSETKKSAFTSIYMNSTEVLKIAISDVLKELKKDTLSVEAKLKLAKDVSGVIKELDKIQRLDDGSPTEIREDRPFAIKDLQKKLKEDPFYKEIDDASFEDIDGSGSDSN